MIIGKMAQLTPGYSASLGQQWADLGQPGCWATTHGVLVEWLNPFWIVSDSVQYAN